MSEITAHMTCVAFSGGTRGGGHLDPEIRGRGPSPPPPGSATGFCENESDVSSYNWCYVFCKLVPLFVFYKIIVSCVHYPLILLKCCSFIPSSSRYSHSCVLLKLMPKLLHFPLLRQYILLFVKANKVYNSDFVPQVKIHITLFHQSCGGSVVERLERWASNPEAPSSSPAWPLPGFFLGCPEVIHPSKEPTGLPPTRCSLRCSRPTHSSNHLYSPYALYRRFWASAILNHVMFYLNYCFIIPERPHKGRG